METDIMELQEQFPINIKPCGFFAGVLLLIFSCQKEYSKRNENAEQTSVFTSIPLDSTSFELKSDTLYYLSKKYSGRVFLLAENKEDTLFVSEYAKGVLHGRQRKWYESGKIAEERFYKNGAKDGVQISFWENGKKRFEFIAKQDAYEGKMFEWDENGMLSHEGNFKNGQEEGIQKMWYANGKIRSNYVIKNGRRYGLLGTKNCKNVDEDLPAVL
jgi:antitoxin component YwqK of YwqJK toxin-antitoxin module